MNQRGRTGGALGARLVLLAVLVVLWALAVSYVWWRSAPPALRRPAVRVAIVLDDFGYSPQGLPDLERLRHPVTCAVLPHLPYSAAAAEAARRSGHEVILHMPMEPHQAADERPQGLEEGTIYTWMAPDQVRRHLDEAIASIPHLRGVSNHMGSRATEDPRLMRLVLARLKSRRFYFLDSVVTNESVVADQARQLGVPCARRDIFLDNDLNEERIVEQLDRLVAAAKERGAAIGIGHDRPVTLKVLRRELPRYAQGGVTFVPVSKLVR